MQAITLVTGNPNKLREFQDIFPAGLELRSQAVDLPEIQSMDTHEIVSDKLARAFKIIKGPVIVEDVSAELVALNGLPGPFMKFAEERLGRDALWKLSKGHDDKRVKIRCTMGYSDGQDETIVDGIVEGTLVPPRGDSGFGFDFSFVLDGQEQTNAELGPEWKNQNSHRYHAAKALVDRLGL